MKLIKLGLTILLLSLSVSSCFAADKASAFDGRCKEYARIYAEQGDSTWLYGVFRQLARQAAGMPFEQHGLDDVIATIKSNHDCNDFTLNGVLRMLYLDRERPVVPDSFKKQARERILDFKYWWDDARRDTTYRCYHTENHQALYHTAELLAGQLHKNDRFTDGKTGTEHMAHASELINPWLDNRLRFGFSEWLSTYYDVEALLLTNLFDFAEDEAIRDKARGVLDLLMLDLALHNHNGYLAGASGRTYATSLITGFHVTSPMVKLMFGVGRYDGRQNTGAIALATSGYRCPDVIAGIATDYDTPIYVRQRTSLDVEDALRYGIDYDNERHCHLFWGMQEFIHPLCVATSKHISEKHDTWPYRNYDEYIALYNREKRETGIAVDRDRFALSEGNITTLRCADYQLSTVNDFRKGKQGYQQHPWMATLGNGVVVYTNHPGGTNLRNSPNYWAGNEILPKSVQHRDVTICLYDIPEGHKTAMTHAYFPTVLMDSVVQRGNWTFGKRGNGYVALYCSATAELTDDFRGEKCDLKAPGRETAWICQVGNAGKWKSFANFVETIAAAPLSVGPGLSVSYAAPGIGTFETSWDEPLRVDGIEIASRTGYRYDTPFGRAAFGADTLTLTRNGETATLRLR